MEPLSIGALIAGASSALGGFAGSQEAKAQRKAQGPLKKFQKTKNILIDDLLASLTGEGKYSDLFTMDEDAFQKAFVDPAKQMFSSQIAPQIQQAGIAGGMQRGSAMGDQLTRAGVDLDQMLNQQYMQYQQQAQDRMSNVLSNIMGQQAPQQLTQDASFASGALGGASGFLQSDAFSDLLKGYLKESGKSTDSSIDSQSRPGFK